ncbi:MAG: hypothetical protein ONB05_00150, partial [candidate division KSB1 bacterium]|nr:hypothetical protein [candidate division KSB1 bacterium]
MQYFQLNCEILSPVHIGTEQEIEPFEYVIANGKFYRIRLEQCLAELPEAAKQKFYELVEQGKINDVRRLIAQHVDLEKHAIYQTAVTSGIETIYRSKLGDLRNQLIIKPFIRTDVTYCPYIPG